MKSELCYGIIDKGLLKYFFLNEFWRGKVKEISKSCEKTTEWGKIVENNRNDKNEVDFDGIGTELRSDVNKLVRKFNNLKIDVGALEKNDMLCLMKFEEERKRKENEMSCANSFIAD